MAIGFNNASKRQAEQMEKKAAKQTMGQMPVNALQAETYERVNQLGNLIMSPQFASLPPEQKQVMLIDFAYFKSVADTL